MDAYEILVIILSVTLFILLICAITLVVFLIKLVKQLRVIGNKAEEIVDDVEAVSDMFRKSSGSIAITSLVSNIVNKVADFKERKSK